jgi:hypothetical protein
MHLYFPAAPVDVRELRTPEGKLNLPVPGALRLVDRAEGLVLSTF